MLFTKVKDLVISVIYPIGESIEINLIRLFNAATGQYCSGDLIFEDTFDLFDLRKWQHENTLSGGGVSLNV